MRIGGVVVAPGINLIGHMSTNLGLGVAARNTARLLQDSGVEFCTIDVPTSAFAANQIRDWERSYWSGAGPAPFSVNLFHINPPELKAELQLKPSWLQTEGRSNVCVPFWELPHLPEDWLAYVSTLDLVLAPSRFVLDTIRRSAPDANVTHFPQTVYLPENVKADRARWGLAEDAIVFVSSFDINSDPARKNPWGAIEAFARAGSALPARARLIVKVNNPSTRMGRDYAEQLRRATASDSRISILEESLTYAEVLSLYASADVFVSLHRSEGLGLGLLESMMLGTPVIATAYSGNMDFTTRDNACLVDFELVPVSSTDSRSGYHGSRIGEGNTWAEPRIDQASGFMVRLAEDPAELARLSTEARLSALATQSSAERTQMPGKLIGLSQKDSVGASALPSFSRAEVMWRRARRTARQTLKAVGLG